MEENKKSKLGLGILIGVLITLVVCMGTFIIYDKVLNNNDDNSKIEDNDNTNIKEDNVVIEKEISINDDTVQNLYKTFVNFCFEYGNIVDSYYKKDITFASELSDSIKHELLIHIIGEHDTTKIDENTGVQLSYWESKTVSSTWKKLFGSTSKPFTNKTFGCFEYQSDGSLTMGPCGGVCMPEVDSNLLKATELNDKKYLYVAVKFIEFNESSSSYKYYKDAEKKIEIGENDPIDANYRFVFNKDSDDNYYFYSVEKVK